MKQQAIGGNNMTITSTLISDVKNRIYNLKEGARRLAYKCPDNRTANEATIMQQRLVALDYMVDKLKTELERSEKSRTNQSLHEISFSERGSL